MQTTSKAMHERKHVEKEPRPSNVKLQALRVLAVSVLTAISWAATPFIAQPLATLVCPFAQTICSQDNGGLMILFIGSVTIVGMVGVLLMRFVARASWLTSLEISSSGIAASIFGSILIGTFGPGQVGGPNPYTLPLSGVIACTAYVAHFYLFVWLSRWRWYMAVAVCVGLLAFYIAAPYIFKGPLDDYMKSRRYVQENERVVAETKKLPFNIYAPSKVPEGYLLISINAHGAYMDTPALFSMTYSTQPWGKPRVNAKSFYINEQLFPAYSPPLKCNDYKPFLDGETTKECVKIGTSSQCEVYYQNRGRDQREAYCNIDGVYIEITADEDVLSQEGIIELLNSFRPADVKALSNESAKYYIQ
ncbi:MAG TPA: hypothetical protein VLA88_02160 [Candidatus Saccharimonadales bacterium]|nr:hypothetical protein [Candidatus Saccharimonadales bacterium]